MVEESPLGPRLETSTGGRLKLVYGERDRALARLGGHIVVLEGHKMFRTLKVQSWTVPEGLHGMAAFIGTLERRGVQLGLTDRNSGAFYLLDEDSWQVLAPFEGEEILVEGYVAGPHVVKVMHHQVLTGP